MRISYPLRVTGRGRTALADESTYLAGLVETVLFTRPGERVNRPDFGSGVDRLVFAPVDAEVAEATRALVQGAVQRWLGDVLRVEDVVVEADDAVLRVTVTYQPLLSGAPVAERRVLTVVGGSGS